MPWLDVEKRRAHDRARRYSPQRVASNERYEKSEPGRAMRVRATTRYHATVGGIFTRVKAAIVSNAKQRGNR